MGSATNRNVRLAGFATGLISLCGSAVMKALQMMGVNIPPQAAPFLLILGLGGMFVGVIFFIIAHLGDDAEAERSSSKSAIPDMILYQALRYVLHRSAWATTRSPSRDDDCLRDLEAEVVGKLATEQLRAWGVLRTRQARDLAPSMIPTDFWRQGQFCIADLVLGRDHVTTAWNFTADGMPYYSDVHFSRREVKAVWPRRGWLAALLRQSPADRCHMPARWREMDRRHLVEEKAQ